MSLYVIVEVRDLDGDLIGYNRMIEGSKKLDNSNIWVEDEIEELRKEVADLNTRLELQAHWPNAHDPAVLAMTEDPDWEPLDFEEVEVIDQVRLQELVDTGQVQVERNEEGEPTVPQDQVPYRWEKVLKDPSQPMARVRKACEIVARERANG